MQQSWHDKKLCQFSFCSRKRSNFAYWQSPNQERCSLTATSLLSESGGDPADYFWRFSDITNGDQVISLVLSEYIQWLQVISQYFRIEQNKNFIGWHKRLFVKRSYSSDGRADDCHLGSIPASALPKMQSLVIWYIKSKHSLYVGWDCIAPLI